MAGLLTYPDFYAFPFNLESNSGCSIKIAIPDYLEPDLQQRELLQIFTAFPFNLLHKNMQTEPLRAQKYILFFYGSKF